MPELPDVETSRRYLAATALHRRIERTRVESPLLLKGISPGRLARTLKGRKIESGRRHGKYLFAVLDDGPCLVLHFGMTGRLAYMRDRRDVPDYTRLQICFENHFLLAYTAPRKLGQIALAESVEAWVAKKKLGPDALDIGEREFLELAARAARHGGRVKSWLMNQHNLAGIGNVYSDEILFQAGIHPGTCLDGMSETELRRMFKAMCTVLREAIAAQADPGRMPSWFLLPYRGQGGGCPACASGLERIRLAGRTSWYCPYCQRP